MRTFTLEYKEDGEIYLDGISSEIYTRGHWGFFQRKLEKLVGKPVKDTVYSLFKKRAKVAVGVYNSRIVEALRIADKRVIAEQLFEQLPKRGYGEPRILSFDDNSGFVVEVRNSFNAVGYNKTKHCVCYALCGIIAGG
ncbi:hypothetical protein HY570_03160, partial [Candidatus Micrarchaeota archaeon]|nr:hypothetical protein [Candidatus Micrarchaeota archaeon]